MDELGRNQFPKECRGCYENCYKALEKSDRRASLLFGILW